MPSGPPDSLLYPDTTDAQFDQTAEVLEMEHFPDSSEPDEAPLEEEKTETQSEDVDDEDSESSEPPKVVENAVVSDGFEWIEWPVGSGVNHYRTADSDEDWRIWPSE